MGYENCEVSLYRAETHGRTEGNMPKYNFTCDYLEGAHPKILERLVETNFVKMPGYGQDEICESAKEKIRAACGCENAEVWFLVGGTQANKTVIDALLRPWQAAVAADTGHIACHESGAIESAGHKVITLPGRDGKLDFSVLENYLKAFYADETYEHQPQPGLVYISHPTENGTLYTKEELLNLGKVCREYSMPLFLDGARLGYGLEADGTDVTLEDIAAICDVFYIGGTKVGALFGEAVVFTRPGMVNHFMTSIKQNGALLAKGRLLGIQFDTLFTDGLYFKISRHAIEMSNILRDGLRKKGYTLCYGSPTNQVFVKLDDKKLEELKNEVIFSTWEKFPDGHTVIRLATSWATREEDIRALLDLM